MHAVSEMVDRRHLPSPGILSAVLALAAASALVVVLALQNRALKAELGVFRERETLDLPYPGLLVPTFTAKAAVGDSIVIGESGEHGAQVLFLLRSTCPHCLRTLPYWNSLVERIGAADLRGVTIYGLSKEPEGDVRRFVEDHELSFVVGSFPSMKLAEMYRVVGVPLTLVLDGYGRVTYARLGALTTEAAVDSVVEAVEKTVKSRPEALLTIESAGNRRR